MVEALPGGAPDDVFRFADALGPEKILHICQPGPGLRAIVVVDNVAAGPSIGGVRMAPDVSVTECVRLARAMTLKNAAASLPHGGGKSVIVADPHMPIGDKERLIRCFATAIAGMTDYIAGPDMGTDERCMAWIKDEIGRSVGLPAVIGGIPLDEIGATGFGVAACAEIAQEFCDLQLAGARVAVQGFGSVGRHASRFLVEMGARLVAVADSRGTLVDPDGLDVERLIALKQVGKSVIDHERGEARETDAIIDVDCDIWIPAARPDVIRPDNAERLRARLVIPGANIPFAPKAEEILHARGILAVPDYIANAGGVICASVEYHGGNEGSAFEAINHKVRANTRAVLERARDTDVLPRTAADAIARERVEAAMACRRWH